MTDFVTQWTDQLYKERDRLQADLYNLVADALTASEGHLLGKLCRFHIEWLDDPPLSATEGGLRSYADNLRKLAAKLQRR